MEAYVALLALGVFFYFLPGIVASQRRHKNRGAIFALTLFLGWTFLGWVIALIWALTANVEAVEASPKEKSAT